MIKHCVFVQFKPEITLAEREALYAAIQALQGHLTGWLGFTSGANVTQEAGMAKGFNGGFIIEFSDTEAHQHYLLDDQHQRVGSKLVNAAVGGIEGIMVFDFNI